MALGESRVHCIPPDPAAGSRHGFPVRRRLLALAFVAVFLGGCTGSVRAPVINRDSRVHNRAPVSTGPAPAAAAQAAATRHRVHSGDTLYSIAFRYGLDYRDLARWNNIPGPYIIYPGQVLRLQPGTSRPRHRQSSADNHVVETNTAAPAGGVRQHVDAAPSPAIEWQWPTRGTLMDTDTPTAKKGIDITGKTGQTVVAAAGGSVVYSGSGLLGYGKLIIIKHNDTFLSAYAHNDKILVKEGDRVTGGQEIATMGIGNDGEPVLHFEIRENGKPVDPLARLPKQHS